VGAAVPVTFYDSKQVGTRDQACECSLPKKADPSVHIILLIENSPWQIEAKEGDS